MNTRESQDRNVATVQDFIEDSKRSPLLAPSVGDYAGSVIQEVRSSDLKAMNSGSDDGTNIKVRLRDDRISKDNRQYFDTAYKAANDDSLTGQRKIKISDNERIRKENRELTETSETHQLNTDFANQRKVRGEDWFKFASNSDEPDTKILHEEVTE